MRVLIAVPPSLFPATGPAFIAASLKRAGHQVGGCIYKSRRELRQCLGEKRYDVFMTGGLCTQFYAIRDMVREAKKVGAITVVGGGIVTAEPALMLRAIGAHYAVLGQGEATAVELLDVLQKGLHPNQVDGIGMFYQLAEPTGRWYKQTDPRKDTANLDSLPFPDYDVFDFRSQLDLMRPSDRSMLSIVDYPREYPLVASRACPYHCTFCYHTSGYNYRCRSILSIMEELRLVVPKYNINLVFIIDELFSANEQRMAEFCTEFNKLREATPWELRWTCGLHVSTVTKPMLDMMRGSGCYLIGYGFESASQTVLTSMRKQATPAQIAFAVKESAARGIIGLGNFIFGDRAETLETAEETLSFWRKYWKTGIYIGTIAHCPNSPNYQYAIRLGLIRNRLRHAVKRLWEPLNITSMSNKDFARLIVRLMRVNSMESPWAVPIKRDFWQVTVRCPHCQQIVFYQNFKLSRWGKSDVYCRECHGRFFISTRLRCWTQHILARVFLHGWLPFYIHKYLTRLRARVERKA